MISKTISHYEIIEKIGAGGMGEVYLADDLKLERQVAIKFLPQHLTQDKENVERFEREAKAAATLNHPNIITIYDVIETDGQICIVMEYVDGESLRNRIDKGKLDHDDVIDITKQICEGLGKAHQADIVHRDIKPENILINTDGRVKILDFGLAKLEGVSKLTKETSTLGTIHYMSPEQIQGKEVDHRSDIWSLGVVLYEMLTGELPFKGEYEQAIIYAILNEEPKPLENIPSGLQDIVKKTVYKNPDERYGSISELLNDLNRIRDNIKTREPLQKYTKTNNTKTRTIIISSIVIFILIAAFASILFFPALKTEQPIKSMAVLPFTNNKPDPNSDYLGFAFAAEIINDMSYFKNITVRPFSSVREVQSKEQLNVDYILTGNFIKLEDRISLNMEFFELETEKIIWQESLNRPFEESHVLLSDVSKKVINGLRIQFSQDERKRMQINIPKDPLAYEYYLRSISFPLTNNGDSLAIAKLQESIKLDSSYAPAFVELGYRYVRLAQNILIHTDERIKSERFYLKALELNSELLSGLNHLAGMYTDIGKTENAIEIVKKALSINPNNALTHFRLSYIYRYAGLLDESEREVERTFELDPDNPRYRSAGNTYRYLGKYAEARQAYALNRGTAYQYENTGAVFLRENKHLKAKENFDRVLDAEPDGISGLSARAMKAYIDGKIKEGLQAARRLEQTKPYDAEVLYDLASVYGLLSDTSSSVRVLKKAVEGGFFCYPFFLIDPFLDPVRDDPEFQEVLALAKEKHEAFKKKYFVE